MGQYKIKDLDNYIESIAYTFEDAVNAVNEKGGSASTEAGFTSIPDAIRSIPAGGEPTWPSVDNTTWNGYGANPADPSVYISLTLQFKKDTHTMEYFILNEEADVYELQSETPYTQNGNTITTMYGAWTMEMYRFNNNVCSIMSMKIKEYPGISVEYDQYAI